MCELMTQTHFSSLSFMNLNLEHRSIQVEKPVPTELPERITLSTCCLNSSGSLILLSGAWQSDSVRALSFPVHPSEAFKGQSLSVAALGLLENGS